MLINSLYVYKEKIHNRSDVMRERCFENLTLLQIHYIFFPFHFFTCIPFVSICLYIVFLVYYKYICLQFTLT